MNEKGESNTAETRERSLLAKSIKKGSAATLCVVRQRGGLRKRTYGPRVYELLPNLMNSWATTRTQAAIQEHLKAR